MFHVESISRTHRQILYRNVSKYLSPSPNWDNKIGKPILRNLFFSQVASCDRSTQILSALLRILQFRHNQTEKNWQ